MDFDATDKKAILRVQCLIRGFLERRRVRKKKLLNFRANYQKQFETLESLLKYKFESYGAVLTIQRWFRRWRYYNKLKWHRKYQKMILKYQCQKKLFRAIRKSGLTDFKQDDLDDKRSTMIASAFVITRLVRGFLGRQRYKRYRRRREIYEEKKDTAAVVLQTFFRKQLTYLHYPLLGYRYRALVKKRRLFEAGKFPNLERWEGCPIDVNLQRRPTILFPHLRLAEYHEWGTLDHHATLIQGIIRRFLAKVHVRNKRKALYLRSVRRIQKWWLGLGWRKKLRLSLKKIQPLWKQRIKAKIKMKHAAIKIQSKFRGFLCHRSYLRYRNRRDIAAKKIQNWAVYRLCLRMVRKKLLNARSRLELVRAGQDLFDASYLHWLCYYTWQGMKKTKTKEVEAGNHELQRIFGANALNNGLDLTKILKLFKECKDLMVEDFTSNSVELQFAKIKSANEKRIDYSKFVDLLANLAAVRFLRVDPPKGCWEEITAMDKDANKATATASSAAAATTSNDTAAHGKRTSTRGATTTTTATATATTTTTTAGGSRPSGITNTNASTETPMQILRRFSYGGLRGKPAFAVKFVLTFFVHLFDYKRAVEYLGARAAPALAQRNVQDNALIIKTFIINRHAVKQITRLLAARKLHKFHERRRLAASKIQRRMRGYLARRQITKLAQLSYSKFVDGETEAEYWFNPRTQTSFWTKPKLLGIYDCGMAVRMPKPEEMFAVNCSICEKVSATCYCQQCDSPMCTSCFAKVHKSGQRKGHQHILVDNCVQCDFQIGTKFCQTCKDIFCDSCFKHMHKKGRLRFHACIRYCSVCDECEDRSAHWRELSTLGTLGVKNWCTTCYRTATGKEPTESKAQRHHNGLERIRFFGKQVQVFLQQRDKEKKEQEIREIFEKRQKELQGKKIVNAVITLQRVWRGYQGRRRIHQFVEERKEMMLIRRDEDRLRESWAYRLKTFFGFPPKLKSDTPLERVKKLYPWYMHRIVAECIENQWSEACKLLVAHEERLSRSTKKASLVESLIAQWQVLWAQRKIDQIEKKMVEVEVLVEAAATSYYNGEASGALPEAKLRALKAAMNKMEKQLQKVQEKREHLEQQLYQAEEHLYDCVGPRGLQTLVNERRRYGVPLPFRLSIRHNSRLALVEWVVPEAPMTSSQRFDDDDAPAEDGDDARSNLTDDALLRDGNNNTAEGGGEPPMGGFDGMSSRLTLRRHSPSSKSKKMQGMTRYELRPGEWRKKLRTGDQIYIDNATFTVSVPLIAKKRLKAKTTPTDGNNSASASASNTARNADSSGGANADNSNNLDASSSRPTTAQDRSNIDDPTDNSRSRSRPGTSDGRNASSGGGGKTNGGGGGGDADDEEEEKEFMEPYTDDHIPLDRPWILPDTFGIDAYKKVTPVFYMRPYYFVKKLVIASYPFQKFAQIMGINWHKVAAMCEYIAEFFDEESPSRPYYLSLAMSATDKKHYWLKMSKTIVNMSYDFNLRKNAYRHVRRMGKLLYSIVKMIRNLVKAANNAVTETPYEYWQRSLEKTDIRVFYEIAAETEIVLGEFRMDLSAPLEIMREYIYRNFRDKLNETVGESFLFLQIDEDSEMEKILPRDDEFRTPSKSFAVKRTDNKTFETFLAVTIIRDQARARVLIPDLNAAPADDDDEEQGDEEEESLLQESDD